MPSRLPDGWPTDHSGLSHDDLDGYRIPSKAGKKELSIEQRREIYRRHYLPSDDERVSGRRRKLTVAGVVLLLGIAVAIFFALTLRSQKDSEEYAVGLCQSQATREGTNEEQSLTLRGDSAVEKDDDGTVTQVSGEATVEKGSASESVDYVCQLSLQDGEYVVDSVELTPAGG